MVVLNKKREENFKNNSKGGKIIWRMFFSLVIYFLCFGFCRAEELPPSLSLAPSVFELKMSPGEKKEQFVKIKNTGSFALPLKISFRPFGIKDFSAQMESLVSSDDLAEFSNWLVFDHQEFILDPGKTEKITFQINLPSDVSQGDYYGLISFDHNYSILEVGGSRAQIIPQAGIPLFLSIGECGPEVVAVEKIYSQPEDQYLFLNKLVSAVGWGDKVEVIKNSRPELVLEIKNQSNCYFRFQGKFFSRWFWSETKKTSLPPWVIFPGKTRKIELAKVEEDFAQKEKFFQPFLGWNQAGMEFYFSDAVKQRSKIFIKISLWELVFLGGLFLAGTIFLIKKRKRIFSLFRLFFKKLLNKAKKSIKKTRKTLDKFRQCDKMK